MRKIFVITSGKGGVGKTTTAINLGAAINRFGKDVVVIDGNISTPNVGVHLNSPEVPINLNHVLMKKSPVQNAVYQHDSGLKIIPSSLSIKEMKKVQPEKMKDFRNDFRKLGEYIIVDSAAGLGNEAMSAMDLADEIIIVTNPELPAITDALKTIKIAEQKKKLVTGVIVTRVRRDDIEMTPDSVKEMLEVPVLGMVPEDRAVQKSLSMKDAVVHTFPSSNAARAYKEIAAKIIGMYYDSDKEKENFFTRVLRKVGLKKD